MNSSPGNVMAPLVVVVEVVNVVVDVSEVELEVDSVVDDSAVDVVVSVVALSPSSTPHAAVWSASKMAISANHRAGNLRLVVTASR